MTIPEVFWLGAPSSAATRNQFHSIQEIIDQTLFRFDLRGWSEDSVQHFRNGLESLAKEVVHETANAFIKGTERGIEQTADILCDPEYYQITQKKRAVTRKKKLDRNREDSERQRQELYSPSTPAQIARKRADLIFKKDYYQQEADRYKKELEDFERTAGAQLDLDKVPSSAVRH